MDPLCNRCSLGPRRVDGHSGLWAVMLGCSVMTFRCDACHSLWARTKVQGDRYAWAVIPDNGAVSADRGIALPPRGTPLPGFAWRATGSLKSVA